MLIKVTDPCYVIDVDEWDKICHKAGDMMGDWSRNFDALVTNYLREKTGEVWAVAGSTYYGDWSNEMRGRPVVSGEFYADAGMWCVVPAEFNERNDMNMLDGAAVLEFDEDTSIRVVVAETNERQWAEIEVYGIKDGRGAYAYSQRYRDE